LQKKKLINKRSPPKPSTPRLADGRGRGGRHGSCGGGHCVGRVQQLAAAPPPPGTTPHRPLQGRQCNTPGHAARRATRPAGALPWPDKGDKVSGVSQYELVLQLKEATSERRRGVGHGLASVYHQRAPARPSMVIGAMHGPCMAMRGLLLSDGAIGSHPKRPACVTAHTQGVGVLA
jgi:hypothetical protein